MQIVKVSGSEPDWTQTADSDTGKSQYHLIRTRWVHEKAKHGHRQRFPHGQARSLVKSTNRSKHEEIAGPLSQWNKTVWHKIVGERSLYTRGTKD